MKEKIVVIATGNAHKVEEFNRLAARAGLRGVRFVSAKEAVPGGMPHVVEDSGTFVGNARLKAAALRALAPADAFVMADDSGLRVDFLGGAPGNMMDVFGVWNEEIDGLPDGMLNSIAVNGKSYKAMELCARIHPLTAEVLGTYEKDFYAGEPALTKNAFGKGAAYYIAARTGVDFLRDFYAEQIAALAIPRALETALPEGVTAHARQNEAGEIIFVENYSGSEKTVDLPRKYKLYGTDQTVNSIKLAPFGFVLLSNLTKI